MARILLLLLTVPVAIAFSDEDESKRTTDPIEIPNQLRPFNGLIGEWRGVGQLKRGSRQGAWSEKTSWGWGFTDGQAVIKATAKDGQRFRSLTFQIEDGNLQLVQDTGDQKLLFRPKPSSEAQSPKLRIFVSKPDREGVSHRCTIRQLSEKRTTILFERQTSAQGAFRRTAEIGYTRSGTSLAQTESSRRECVVTGGRGTIAVSHKGNTWYVCCTGCLQAFQQNPDKVIARYLASKKGE